MTIMLRLACVSLALGVALAACGNDGDSSPSSDGTATGTGTGHRGSPTAHPGPVPSPPPAISPIFRLPPTASPSSTEEPEGTPHASPPDTLPGLEVLGTGELNLTIGPGDSKGFDPQELAKDLDIDMPPCGGFIFAFGWQVRRPYPPDGVDLTITWTSTGEPQVIGEGPSGKRSLGCGSVDVVNDSDFEVAVEIRYSIAKI